MSTTFSVSRDDILNRAFRLTGVFDSTNLPSSTDYTNASLALNMIIKTWIRTLPLWKVVTVQVPLLQGQSLYQVGPFATGTGAVVTPRIVRTIYGFIRDSGNHDTEMDSISFEEYNMYSDKLTQATPVSYMYVPLDDSSTTSSYVQFYPTPADSTHTFFMVGHQTINDVNVGTDPIDFPQEEYLALAWAVADEIALENNVSLERAAYIAQRAKQAFEDMWDWINENTDSVRFQYDTRGR